MAVVVVAQVAAQVAMVLLGAALVAQGVALAALALMETQST
jgi:hypothetical protein